MNNVVWEGFAKGVWCDEINVADFIKKNYNEYTGSSDFLVGPTDKTVNVRTKLAEYEKIEKENNGVYKIDTDIVSSLVTYGPGYIDRENEIIVGLQTDEPLKRPVNPFGGMRMARAACEAYGFKLSDDIENAFKFKSTHNDGVFRAYSSEMKTVRKLGLITGLPDAYGRGRIIGDYRRVALYGIDKIIEFKRADKMALAKLPFNEDNIRLAEELFKQIEFLNKLKDMAQLYGIDISQPAQTAKQAVQWLYFGYLGAIKEQNGAAMSLGRTSTFIDIYIERDLKNGTIDETQAQEIIDQFVIKLRTARHLRTPDYNELFGGDPMWITESIAGITLEGKSFVTKSSFRFLQTLYNLGESPEPNLTVLWSEKLPLAFKQFCAKVSIDTDAIQYENDDLMRQYYDDDYAIACCVSAMKVGKQMQFFGARCNLPKVLLFALNGGVDEGTGLKCGPEDNVYDGEFLEYDEVEKRLEKYLDWIANLYVNTMNVIHYMHDKYAYEKTQMALHDTYVHRFMAFGIAGLSVIADSLSAIKYAKVKPIRNEEGLIIDFETTGEFPKYGNDDDRVDSIAVMLVEKFYNKLKQTPTYRNSEHTLSILTITSNVVYGKKTGATPDGRAKGEPFAPGANPMHNREINGALASLNSVAKLPYECCRDGISNTFSIIPKALGKDDNTRVNNLVSIMDGYFTKNAHHLNVNVLNREKLIAAYNDDQAYPNITIRVSGYAVNFHKLSKDQQLEVISRTFHTNM